jgi:hypothetical protein
MEEAMKKLILVGALALMTSGAAFAQASQGQAAGQAGVNGNAANTPENTMRSDGMRSDGMRSGTVGMDSGRTGQNGSPNSMPRSQDSSTGRASEGQTAPK